MAEQALRRLMEASKAGVEKTRQASAARGRGQVHSTKAWLAALDTIQQTDQAELERDEPEHDEWEDEEDEAPPFIGATKTKIVPSTSFESATVVNHDKQYWRTSARLKS